MDCRLSEGKKCANAVDNGCEQDSPIPGRWELDGETFLRCPIKLVTQQTAVFIKYFRFFKDGFLPNEGTIAHQPAKLVKAFQIIGAEAERLDDEKRKAREEELRRKK